MFHPDSFPHRCVKPEPLFLFVPAAPAGLQGRRDVQVLWSPCPGGAQEVPGQEPVAAAAGCACGQGVPVWSDAAGNEQAPIVSSPSEL